MMFKTPSDYRYSLLSSELPTSRSLSVPRPSALSAPSTSQALHRPRYQKLLCERRNPVSLLGEKVFPSILFPPACGYHSLKGNNWRVGNRTVNYSGAGYAESSQISTGEGERALRPKRKGKLQTLAKPRLALLLSLYS